VGDGRCSGACSALPAQINADTIEAKLENGVLTIRVPKAQKAQRRKIEITSLAN
jgi:HSP20 family molecular chaperone IbpA